MTAVTAAAAPGAVAAGVAVAVAVVLWCAPARARLRGGGRRRAGAAPRSPLLRRGAAPRRWLPRAGAAGDRASLALLARSAAELAALLRAGAAPPVAWAQLEVGRGGGGVAALLDSAARAGARGGDPAAVLVAGAGALRGDPARAVRALAAAWTLAQRTGAPAAEVLERVADWSSTGVELADARTAALAAPRATARVLLALPPAGVLLGVVAGADPLHTLLLTPLGRLCAVLGTGLTLAAWAWTRALVRSAERAR